MKLEGTKKIKDKLKTKIQKNIDINAINNDRTELSRQNQSHYQTLRIFFLSLISYLILFIASSFLINGFGISAITNIIPTQIFPFVIIGSSLGLGIVGNMIISKKNHTKEKIRKFSKAKNEVEKLEEQMYYEIEKEKINNRNKVLEQTVSMLETYEANPQLIYSQYEINEINDLTEEKLNEKLSKLNDILNKKYEELDVVATQKVLSEKFEIVRFKYQSSINTIITMLVGMATGMYFLSMSAVLVSVSIFSNSISFFQTFIPMLIGTVGVTCYCIKRNIDYKKVFNKLNNELGTNSLPQEENIDEEFEHLKRLANALINNIKITELQTIKYQLARETISEEKTSSKEETNKDLQKISPISNEEITPYHQETEKNKKHSLVRKKGIDYNYKNLY